MNRAEVDGVFQRNCTATTSAPTTDVVMASIAGAAAIGLLIAGGSMMAEDAAMNEETGEGSVVGGIFMGMSALPILAGALWGASAGHGYSNAARCAELRERFPTCASTPECTSQGRCTWESPRCIAKTVADCAASDACTKQGRCTPNGGVCVASGDVNDVPRAPVAGQSAEECRASSRCRELGLCGARDGVCVPTAVADCKAALVCRTEGRCSLGESRCIAISDEQCRESEACTLEGRCVARYGACVNPG